MNGNGELQSAGIIPYLLAAASIEQVWKRAGVSKNAK
jgi:hypothetical protein